MLRDLIKTGSDTDNNLKVLSSGTKACSGYIQ